MLYKAAIATSVALLLIDLIYKTAFGITIQTRDRCFLFRNLPRAGFLFYEYFIELLLILVTGIFIAVVLESYFSRYQRIYPKNIFTAFLVASILPVCSCSAIPLIETMKGQLRLSTIMTFVVAAPLLSPYIIVLSFTTLGVRYALLRILSAFVLAASTGLVVAALFGRKTDTAAHGLLGCGSSGCTITRQGYSIDTFRILRRVFPYFLIAAAMGMGFELLTPADLLRSTDLNQSLTGLLLVTIIGVPIYFCNGADVLFLSPLMYYSGLPMGTAIAFSLTSTSVCATSLVMLYKFIGLRLTGVLLGTVVFVTLAIGAVLNAL